LGSLGAVCDGRLRFVSDLEQNLVKGDETFEQFTRSVDAYIVRHRLSCPEEAPCAVRDRFRLPVNSTTMDLDVSAAAITSVIWAIGYRHDFSWIKGAALDTHGNPIHQRGVNPMPGLYFLGLPRLHKVKSAFLWGVGEDAAYLAEQILNRT
jgi:putative flavoprotein involved in K+ transport